MIVPLAYLLCAGGFRIMRYMLSIRERNLDLFLKPKPVSTILNPIVLP